MNRKMLMRVIAIALLCLGLVISTTSVKADEIIANHYSVGEFSSIPDSFIQAIGEDYLIFYGHTSHGSQIVTGLNILYEEDTLYYPPYFSEYGDDLGGYGDTTWVPPTRDFLNTNPNYNLVMWSWCGGVSDNTEEGINIYLNAMNGLEQDYPNMKFIYMTGHLDGSGPSGNLYARNNQIRAYCTANNKTLFDFADIESYDPDGSYYPDASDACEWCNTWCSSHPCPTCDCAHSQCFNCYQKGKAWWWMMAKISGWNQTQDSIPHIVSTSPAQNQLNVPVNANISVTFNTPMDETTINDSTFVVNAWSTGLHTGSITYNSVTKTATLNPDSDFVVGEIVTVVLTTGIKSSVGTPLESSYVWSFSIEVTNGYARFSSPHSYGVGGYPLSVFCADLDGDNDLDLAVANYNSNTVSILKNNGDGSFQSAVNYSVGNAPSSVFCADLDGDTDLDLAVLNWGPYTVSILKNNGDGTFQHKVDYSVGFGAWSVFCADLDGDADLDLAVSNNGRTTVSILKNYGDGSFQSPVSYETGYDPYSVFCADLDGDFDLDLAVANSSSNNLSILKNNGDGTFSSAVNYEVGNRPVSVFCADLDGDSDIDIAVANEYSGNISILKNNGDGTFQNALNYDSGWWTKSVFCADLDGDGDMDLAAANEYSHSVSIFKNSGDGSFQSKVEYWAQYYPNYVFCADLDRDGDLDLIAVNGLDTVSVLFNCFQAGDCNLSGDVELGDVVYLINYLYKNGLAPDPLLEGDVNCDGVVELGDVVYLITYLYKNGPAPCC